LSVPLPSLHGTFQEKLAPGAFRHVLGSDVRALWNHDPAFVLGRTTNGTLRLAEDDKGLRFEIDPPDTMLAASFMGNIERGDVSQMSFGFAVEKDGQSWDRSVKPNLRTITAVSELRDISPVTYPAYPTTEVALRAFMEDDPCQEFDGKQEVPQEEERIQEDSSLEDTPTEAAAEDATLTAETPKVSPAEEPPADARSAQQTLKESPPEEIPAEQTPEATPTESTGQEPVENTESTESTAREAGLRAQADERKRMIQIVTAWEE
jgi:HK97 family phage prohead protease